jgi:aspartate/methionine/tyrosine aminotransferase
MASFSRRLDWDRTENLLAEAEARRRAAGAPVLDLTETNPTAVNLPYPAEEIARALCHPTAAARYQPSPRGAEEARRLVADAHAAAGRGPLGPERLVLTASSSESYGFLFKLLCDPGDAVLVPEPSYPLFDYLARLEGVVPVPYRFGYDGGDWRLDPDSLDRAIGRAGRPRALVVVSPNNPTGAVLRAEELALLDARAAGVGAALIADEVFADYVRPDLGEPRVRSVAACPTRALSFALGGLSKSCGLPQLKLGWIAVGGPAEAAAAALAGLELVSDTYLSVSAAVTAGLAELLQIGGRLRAGIAARVADNRRRLAEAARPPAPFTLLPADGGWSAILRLPATRTDEAWSLALLEEDGVLVHPGYFFDLPSGPFVVLSLLPDPATVFEPAIQRLADNIAR